MATIQTINIGASANDNTGDPLRTAFDKQNQNNTALNNELITKAPLANPNFSTDINVNTVKLGLGNNGLANNTVVGNGSGVVITTANFCSLFGNYAGLKLTTGANNSFFGHGAGAQNTTGFSNTFIGQAAGSSNIIGNGNTFIGQNSGQNTKSDYGTFLGYQSGFSNTTASGNTFIGQNSGYNNNTGGFNTYIGTSSGLGTNYINGSALGYNSAITGDSQVQLGNSSTTTYVYGTVQNRSDSRDKADIKDTVLGLDFISKLRPVDYRWDMREDYKTELPIQGELSDEDFKIKMDLWLENNKLANLKQDGSKIRNRFHHGFIAQEIRDLGIDFGGFQDHSLKGGEDVLSIGYDEFIAPMIKAIQELKAEIELLKMK